METIAQRDIRDLANLRRLDAIPKLLQMVAGQSAHLLNVSSLAGPFHLTRPTIREYVGLLEKVFLVDVLPPWHSNRLKRLIKTPKLHMGDTGLAAVLQRLPGVETVAAGYGWAVFGRRGPVRRRWCVIVWRPSVCSTCQRLVGELTA